jgi:hypothetical protein
VKNEDDHIIFIQFDNNKTNSRTERRTDARCVRSTVHSSTSILSRLLILVVQDVADFGQKVSKNETSETRKVANFNYIF